MPSLESRIDELEMRVAHQEKTIGELNDALTSHWRLMEAMERQLRRMGEELADLGSGDAPPANQKPPHY